MLKHSLAGLLWLANVQALTLSRTSRETPPQHPAEQQMVADMLELARADEIKAACPRANTYCISRVKCPVKDVVYDREGTRFVMGPESVKFL